jgi:hypothetical protein
MTGDELRFDDQPVLTGPTLTLRPLTASDRDGLFAAAANPEIWAGHPIKERYKPEVFHPYFTFLLEAGGTLAITTSKDRKIIAVRVITVLRNVRAVSASGSRSSTMPIGVGLRISRSSALC